MMWLYYFLDVSKNLGSVVFFMIVTGVILTLLSAATFAMSFEEERGSAQFGEFRAMSFISLKVAIILFALSLAIGVIKPSKEASAFLIEEIKKEIVNGN